MFERYDNMSLDELMVERDELCKDLDYEKITMRLVRCRTSDGMAEQMQVEDDLKKCIDYVSTLIKERTLNEALG